MNDDFYKVFEDRFRGSRELIKERLRVYLPFVVPIARLVPGGQTLDLGCGRGEWLELMLEIGFKPFGIDMDDGMLQACQERNLPVHKGDASAYITELPDESQVVVSAFHVVEHISFDQLRSMVSEAFRVLKPGGMLIMETPNPENITVATSNFYLDPTHQRPVPHQLLSFLPEYYGFKRVKTIRLQESKELMGHDPLTLSDVLAGASPDYAVIAQKSGDDIVSHVADNAFLREYGLSLETLATRYQTQIDAKIQQAEAQAEKARDEAQKLHMELKTVYESLSWRITRPFRLLLSGIRWTIKTPASAVKKLIAKAMVFAIRNNFLRLKLLGLVNAYPRLKALLFAIGEERGIFSQPAISPDKTNQKSRMQGNNNTDDTRLLTPMARTIYIDLKNAIEQSNQENG